MKLTITNVSGLYFGPVRKEADGVYRRVLFVSSVNGRDEKIIFKGNGPKDLNVGHADEDEDGPVILQGKQF